MQPVQTLISGNGKHVQQSSHEYGLVVRHTAALIYEWEEIAMQSSETLMHTEFPTPIYADHLLSGGI
jgi:hypothetical protein